MTKAGPVPFSVAINGRSWNVTIERTDRAGRFRATIDGRALLLDVVWLDAGTLSLLVGDDTGDGGFAVEEIGLAARRQGELDVSLRGRVFTAAVGQGAGTAGKQSRTEDALGVAGGRQVIRSPMPGRVVRVLVAPGDRVLARQGVVVVEAMKMENELRSPKDGVVREVAVREGATVDAGAILAVID